MIRPIRSKSSIERIADLDPLLRAAYEEETAYWSPDAPGRTLLASALASALVANFDDIRDSIVYRIFAVCEATLESRANDDDIAIATGFLEGLQHADGRGDFDFQQIVTHLGEKSRAHCIAMDEFHGTSTRGLT